ncbi:MAG: response regulator [Alphaproteobacteria bacterium]|nr:response regulator [Alphaproteobacteria bacterium]
MFHTKRQMYQKFAATQAHACQIRSPANAVLASNAPGLDVFGTGENPFLFLNNTPDTDRLIDALCTRTATDIEIKTDTSIYQVAVKPLGRDLLLTAQEKTSDFIIHQSLSQQLAIVSGVLSALTEPLYLTDAHDVIVYANQSFCRLLGRTTDKILGQKIGQVLPAHDKNVVILKRDDQDAAYTISHQPIPNLHLKMTCSVLRPYVPQSHLTKTELFEEAPIPCLLVNTINQKVMQANKAFGKALDKAPADIENLPISEIFTEESYKAFAQKVDRILARQPDADPVELATAEAFGDKNFNTFVTSVGQEKDSLLLYMVDVSTRKNLEAQVAHAQKMQAIGQLAGGIAHDFNNLLTAIIGFTDMLLQRHRENDDAFMDLMQIKGNANKAASMVGQLLTFSRKQPVQERLFSIHDAFIDLSGLLQRSLAPFGLLKMDIRRNLGFVKLDKGQLTQIFLNLAVNSKEAMPNGGTFKIAANIEKIKKSRPIGNDTLTPGEYVKIMVSDTGTGIDAVHIPHIFEPFFTTKGTGGKSGTGLGLSTVYGLIRGANGFISVDSVPNVGTTFTIYLPRFKEGAPTAEDADRQPALPLIQKPKTETNIMLVDDDSGVRMISARALKTIGFNVVDFCNAEQALEHLAPNNLPHLVISDMIMPGMDGETFLKAIHKNHPDVKKLLISGYSEDIRRQASEEKETFAFLAKPFDLKQLVQKINEILGY